MEQLGSIPDRGTWRLSDSPAGSPKFVYTPSPPRSVYGEMEESNHDEPDEGMRTIDFFDYGSDVDDPGQSGSHRGHIAIPGNDDASPNQKTGNPQEAEPDRFVTDCKSKTAQSSDDDFIQFSSNAIGPCFDDPFLDKPWEDSSGSAEEGEARRVRLTPSGSPKVVHHKSPRTSGVYDDERVTAIDIHGMSLNAPEGQTDAIIVGKRKSQASYGGHSRTRSDAGTQTRTKRVNVLPPPIAVPGHNHHAPSNIVRTPYPFTHRKTFHRPSPLSMEPSRPPPDPPRESVLPISLRRNNDRLCPRVTSLSIPTNLDFAAIKVHSPTGKEQYFQSLDFDDAFLFESLRRAYAQLAGPFRWMSARTLRTITVGHSASCPHPPAGFPSLALGSVLPLAALPEDGKAHYQPRSPRLLAARGLADTFSTQNLLRHYRKPKLGKARYAWVHWAHRLAATGPPSALGADADARRISYRESEGEGLEDDSEETGTAPQLSSLNFGGNITSTSDSSDYGEQATPVAGYRTPIHHPTPSETDDTDEKEDLPLKPPGAIRPASPSAATLKTMTSATTAAQGATGMDHTRSTSSGKAPIASSRMVSSSTGMQTSDFEVRRPVSGTRSIDGHDYRFSRPLSSAYSSSQSQPHPAPAPHRASQAPQTQHSHVRAHSHAPAHTHTQVHSRDNESIDCVPRLEFVQGWSRLRIVVAFLLVLLLAVAAVLLWVFLGEGEVGADLGFRHAGGRVQGGLLMGIVVLLAGAIGVGGWIWVSWLVE